MNPTDRLRLEESALQYAIAVRAAMSQYRRSAKKRLVDSSYTVYTMTRTSRNGTMPTVRTAADYTFGATRSTPEVHRKVEWEMFDRFMFMQDLEKRLPETQLLLEVLENLLGVTPEDAMKSVKRICSAVLDSRGQVPSRRRVETVVRQLVPTVAGEAVPWTLKAEINGVWPEGTSTRLSQDIKLSQLRSVQYRSDVDALNFVSGIPWEQIPDAAIKIVRRATDTREVEDQLRVLVRVLTLFGPNRVRLIRFARSQPGVGSLVPANAASDRLGDSGGEYCIRKNQAARCRGFIRRMSPLLGNRPDDLPENSLARIAVTAMSLLDEGFERQRDTVSAIAYKVVCLESLYLTDDESSAISYRLGNRAAATLAMLNGTDACQAIAHIKDAYAVRSGFFHGHVKLNVGKKATKELDDRLGDYCRISISAFLQCGGMNRKSFLHELDTGMVDPRSRTALQQKLQRQRFSFPLTAAECSQPH